MQFFGCFTSPLLKNEKKTEGFAEEFLINGQCRLQWLTELVGGRM